MKYWVVYTTWRRYFTNKEQLRNRVKHEVVIGTIRWLLRVSPYNAPANAASQLQLTKVLPPAPVVLKWDDRQSSHITLYTDGNGKKDCYMLSAKYRLFTSIEHWESSRRNLVRIVHILVCDRCPKHVMWYIYDVIKPLNKYCRVFLAVFY